MRRSGWVLASLGVWVACAPAVVPPAVPLPGPLPVQAAPGGANFRWSFEEGLGGWQREAGDPEPVCDPVPVDRLPASLLPNLGGDYWKTNIDVGQQGRCRLDTSVGSRKPTRLVSPSFTIRQPFLSFLVGAGGKPGTRVSLRLAGVADGRAPEEHGTGQLQMGRVTWDVHALVGRHAQVVVEDAGGDGILVDDVFDSAEAPPPRPPPVWGFADTHSHPVAQLGFGRHVFVGATDGPIEDALASCDKEHGKNGDGGKAGIVIGGVEPSFNRIFGHRPTGYPDFDGWPRWSTLVHQQMYFKWIERAWRGGLRLLVAHANNNEQLAANTHGVTPYDDMNVAESELEELKKLAQAHDFMAIADTPAKAREIIASGRLAVVLGVEVDAIGGCRRDEDCDDQKAIAAIDWLWKAGARHVFPIHLADNAFGGAAVWYNGVYDLLNWYLRNDYQTLAHDDSVAFTLSPAHQWYPVWFAALSFATNRYGIGPYEPPFDDYGKVPAGHVNARGLTRVGRDVLDEMRRLGMIVDIDHMSERARAETLSLFAQSGTPVAMGHTWFRDLGYDQHETHDWLKLRNEIMKTADEVEAVRRLGGIVSPITNQHDVRRVEGSGSGNDCEGASTSWLQAYVYTVERMGGAGVGVGTDFNGLPGQPLPRFGPFACTGRENVDGGNDWPRRAPGLSPVQTVRADADAQDAGVTYDVPIKYAWTNRFYGPRDPRDDPYTPEERAVWIAKAECRAGIDPRRPPDSDLQNGQLPGSARARTWTPPRDVVVPVASGLCGYPQNGLHDWWQAAALVRAGGPRPTSVGLRRRYDLIAGIDAQWKRMEAGNPSAPLERFFYDDDRQHDGDINLDGLAHYGLLPDFFQDVANQLRRRGAAVSDLSALFRSAETYLEMWERVEASAGK